LGQSDAAVVTDDALPALLELPVLPPLLLLEPQAVSAMVPTRATLASWPRRWIFTVLNLSAGEIEGGRSCPTLRS
jgi:hypothetical protein